MSNTTLKAGLGRVALWASTMAVLMAATAGTSAKPASSASDDRAIVHVLNRVTFGPGPGDLERVRAVGVARFIDDQLHPERLADTGMDAHLASLETLRLTSREIARAVRNPATAGPGSKAAGGGSE